MQDGCDEEVVGLKVEGDGELEGIREAIYGPSSECSTGGRERGDGLCMCVSARARNSTDSLWIYMCELVSNIIGSSSRPREESAL